MTVHNLKIIMLAGALASICLTGCTGAKVIVTPNTSSIQYSEKYICGSVGISDGNAENDNTSRNVAVLDFADYIERSNIFEKVYCPIRNGDTYNYRIKSYFSYTYDPKYSSNILKGLLIGFSLFTLEPAIPYVDEYNIYGRIDIYDNNNNIITKYDEKINVILSYKFFSMSDRSKEKDVFVYGLKSLYNQLLKDIVMFCENNHTHKINESR